MTILWLAMLLSVGLMGGVGAYLGTIRPETELNLAMPIAFMLLAGLGVGAQLWLRRRHEDERMFQRLRQRDSPMFRPGAQGSRAERGASAILAIRSTESILIWGMGESFAVYGIVLSLLSGQPGWALGFSGAAALDLIVFFPSRSKAEEQISRWSEAPKVRK